jgi:hypothetical protein
VHAKKEPLSYCIQFQAPLRYYNCLVLNRLPHPAAAAAAAAAATAADLCGHNQMVEA